MNLKNKLISIMTVGVIIATSSISIVKANATEKSNESQMLQNYSNQNYTKLEQSKNYISQGALILDMGLNGEVHIYDPSGTHIYTVESASTVYHKSKAILPIYESGEYTFEIKELYPQSNTSWEVFYTQDITSQINSNFDISGKNDDLIIFNSPMDQTINLEINYEGTPNLNQEHGVINLLNQRGEIVQELLDVDQNSQSLKTDVNVKQGINILEVYLTKGQINWNIKAQTAQIQDISGNWAEAEINDFINKGYINGKPDKTFGPGDDIKRGEFVKTLNRVFGLTEKSGKVFNDTVSHWAKDEIDIAVTNGVCKGISDTEFSPDAPMTRETAAKMIAGYMKIADADHDKMIAYPDYEEVSYWAKDELEASIERGYIRGTPEGRLNPKGLLTKAEAVVILGRAQN